MFTVPKVTGPLRERVLALAADPSPVAQRCCGLLEQTEDSYAQLLPTVRQDVLQFLEFVARLWFNSIPGGARCN